MAMVGLEDCSEQFAGLLFGLLFLNFLQIILNQLSNYVRCGYSFHRTVNLQPLMDFLI
jgi:hypothetical protein